MNRELFSNKEIMRNSAKMAWGVAFKADAPGSGALARLKFLPREIDPN